MNPLIEVTYPDFQVVEEATKDNGGRMRVKCLMQVADEINGNGRFYPEAILDREVLRMQEEIKRQSAYGEADHPGDGKSRISNTASRLLNLEKAVTDKGRKEYWGEVMILNTSKGKDVQEILNSGGRLGHSSRGFGTTKASTLDGKKGECVQDDYRLKAFDFVIGQSVKDADVRLGEGLYEQTLDVVSIFESEEQGVEGDAAVRPKTEIEKGGHETMELTLEALKKDHPKLVEAIKAELEAQLKESIQKELDASFDQRLAEEIEKRKDEIRDDVVEAIKSSEEFQSYKGVVDEITALLRKYDLVESGSGEDGTDKEKDEQLATLRQELKTEKEERVKLSEQLGGMKVKDHIAEVVKGKAHASLLAERLADCKTEEEVNERLEKEEDYIKRITEASGTPAGKGKVKDEDNPSQQVIEGEEDEEKKAQMERDRRLAGLPPLEEKKES